MTPAPPDSLNILFLDNHLIAVEKPFGVLTQGDATGHPSLLERTRAWIKSEFKKPGNVFLGLVHRLDRPVAGVVLFARTSKAASRLARQFRERRPRKIYRAAVENRMDTKEGKLEHYILKGKKRKSTVFPRPAPGAKPAELVYRVLDSSASASLLEVMPITGRFHQIRAQLAFIHHPILGDVKYGASRPLPGRNIALFARQLIFDHPVTGEETCIVAPEPEGWAGEETW